MEIIMKYMYGQHPAWHQEDILTMMETLDHAKDMGLDDLEQNLEEALCDNFLVDDLKDECAENVIKILNEAVKRKRETLIVDASNFINDKFEIFADSSSFNDLSHQSVLALLTASKLGSRSESQHFNTHVHNAVIKWLFHENSLENNFKQSILDKLDMEFILEENLLDLMQKKILDSVQQILEENVEEIEGLKSELEDLKAQLQKKGSESDRFLMNSKLKKIVNNIHAVATNPPFLLQILPTSSTSNTVRMIGSCVFNNFITNSSGPIIDVIIHPIYQFLDYLNIGSSIEINNNDQKEGDRNKEV